MEFIKLLKFMAKEKKQVLLAFLLGFFAAISSVGLMGTGGYLISKAALEPPLYTLTFAIIAVRAFGISRAASRYGERYYSHKATFTILGRIRMYVYDKMEPIAPKIFSYFRSGDILSRVVSDVDRIQFFFLRVVYPPLVMIAVFLCTMIFMINFSLGMTFLLIIGLIIASIVIPAVFAALLKKGYPNMREKNSHLWNHATDILYGFVDLKTNLRLNSKSEALEKASEQLIAAQEKSNIIEMRAETISFFVSLVITWGVLFIGTYQVVTGSLNGVFLAMLVLITLTVYETSTPISSLPSQINESYEAGKRLFSVTEKNMNHVTRVGDSTEKVQFSITTDRPVPIEFKNMSFAYPNSERLTLKNIQFTIEPKEKVAIVGHSGSGKSTLIQLLLQFQTDYEGSITVDGKELKTIDYEENRKLYSVVLQENHYFYDTVKNNLLLANPDATDEQLRKVLDDVALNHLTLDYMLTERAMNISGGERQRLAIARMLLKDAPIVLLDELTTGIDAVTEREILSILWPHVQEKSVVYITHRLRDLDKMDKIIVMDKGRIVEQGTYDELVSDEESYFYRIKKLEEELVL